jgi:hypothetical protein
MSSPTLGPTEYGVVPAVKATLHHRGFGDYASHTPMVGLDEATTMTLVSRWWHISSAG